MTAPVRIEVEFTFQSPRTVEEALEGSLRLFAFDRLIWGRSHEGVEWCWTDLLEALARCWRYVLYERAPATAGADRPTACMARVRTSWRAQAQTGQISISEEADFEDQAFAWEDRHDFSRWLPGTRLPEIVVCAMDGGVAVETLVLLRTTPLEDARQAFTSLGERLLSRLDGLDDARVPEIRRAWQEREPQAADEWASKATGWSVEALEFARAGRSEAEAWGDGDGRMGASRCLIVAASCRNIGRHSLRMLFGLIREPQAGADWERAYASMLDASDFSSVRHPMGASSMANEARKLLELGAGDPLPSIGSLGSLGIRVVEASFDESEFTGLLLCWPGDAPLLVVNTSGAQELSSSRRMAVANAIADAVAAMDSGRPSAGPLRCLGDGEDRFATEFLIPTTAVEAAPLGSAKGFDVLSWAIRSFDVPETVAAAQIMRSALPGHLPPSTRERLKAIASNREKGPPATSLAEVA